ncbi:MAG: hypothetical protein JW829_10985 [Pirellulales bacterium]|nr:hypothetical protein [Pirellulales bacterium]
MPRAILLCLFLLGIFSSCILANDDPARTEVPVKGEDTVKAEDSVKAEDPVKTHEIQPGPFRIDVKIEGLFVADKKTELALFPKEWSDFTVVEAVAHGQVVHQGDLLVRFDNTEISEQIADLEADQRLAELSIIQAERDLPQFEQVLALAYASAERDSQYASQDLARFAEIDRPLAERSAEHYLKQARHGLEYAKEELDQLLKMYEADDLTEETEEIILKRQRHEVESAEFALKQSEINFEETVHLQLPRQEASLKHNVEQAKHALDQAKINLELKVNQKQFELEKSKHVRKRALERHAKLLADQGLMTIKAPTDGVVYYGQCLHGKWPNIKTMMQSLRPKGTVASEAVFMTIVTPRPLLVLGQAAEKDMAGFQEGLVAQIKPTANPAVAIAGRIGRVSTIPVEDGQFAVEFILDSNQVPEWIVAGMTCKAIVTTYERSNALTVPCKAVKTEPANPADKYVHILDQQTNQPRRQAVKTGRESGQVVEIVEGLAPGNRVVLEEVDE